MTIPIRVVVSQQHLQKNEFKGISMCTKDEKEGRKEGRERGKERGGIAHLEMFSHEQREELLHLDYYWVGIGNQKSISEPNKRVNM
jgi:hypothetical protein